MIVWSGYISVSKKL